MKGLCRDILTAAALGLVLPGLLLNLAVMRRQHSAQIESIRITIPQETEPVRPGVPMLQRLSSGETVQRELEDYLVEVVLAEMPAYFETEALKAQAVAARTYTRKAWVTGGKHGDGSVCTDPACCQAYLSEADYLSSGGTREGLEKVRAAVQATAGLCLSYDGELIEATYFSSSGGSTEDAAAVWGTDYPYLRAVSSPGEAASAVSGDTVVLTKPELEASLGILLPEDREAWFGPVTYTNGGGVETMDIGGVSFSGTQLRSLLGLRSTAFTVTTDGETITLTTRGYGHRVGMSQYGADAMAVSGKDFSQILAHYYPGTELMKLGHSG